MGHQENLKQILIEIEKSRVSQGFLAYLCGCSLSTLSELLKKSDESFTETQTKLIDTLKKMLVELKKLKESGGEGEFVVPAKQLNNESYINSGVTLDRPQEVNLDSAAGERGRQSRDCVLVTEGKFAKLVQLMEDVTGASTAWKIEDEVTRRVVKENDVVAEEALKNFDDFITKESAIFSTPENPSTNTPRKISDHLALERKKETARGAIKSAYDKLRARNIFLSLGVVTHLAKIVDEPGTKTSKDIHAPFLVFHFGSEERPVIVNFNCTHQQQDLDNLEIIRDKFPELIVDKEDSTMGP